ncbi:MAG: hypothetical protein ACOYOE_14010 [Chlorobium sp.]
MAGNFHPDIIFWLIEDGKQRIIIIDPKGIRNLAANDPRLQFHQTIKEIEHPFGDPEVSLESFIVSNTSSATMSLQWNMAKPQMQQRNILFQDQERAVTPALDCAIQ